MSASERIRILRGLAVAQGPKGLPGSLTTDDRLDARYAVAPIQLNGVEVKPCCAASLPLVLTLMFDSGGRSVTLDSPLVIYGTGFIDIGDGVLQPLSMITEWSTLAGLTVKVYASVPLSLVLYQGQLLTNVTFAPTTFENINLAGISDVSRGALTSVDLTGVTSPDQTFYFSNNNISALTIDSATFALGWYFNNNNLTTLDLSTKTSANVFFLDNNPFTSLTLPSANSNLLELDVNSCGLSILVVSGYSSLQRLYCIDNSLTALNISGNPELQALYCDGNQLTSLDVEGLIGLNEIICIDNLIDQGGANTIVSALVQNGTTDGTLNLTGNPDVTNPGTGDWSTLASRGWSISPAP